MLEKLKGIHGHPFQKKSEIEYFFPIAKRFSDRDKWMNNKFNRFTGLKRRTEMFRPVNRGRFQD